MGQPGDEPTPWVGYAILIVGFALLAAMVALIVLLCFN